VSTLKTAVMFLFFRRPEPTARVFERIREARPPKLYLIADGPRPEVADDEPLAEATRAVVERVDWPCEVIRDYSERNLGMQRRTVTGIDLILEQEGEGIILEDDCLPHPTFFRWCEEMLDRYRDDERVMHISGSQLLPRASGNGASYYFSRYVHVWGWATWQRAWAWYDNDLTDWHSKSEKEREAQLRRMYDEESERRYWRYVWNNSERIDTWDSLWSYVVQSRGLLAANPNTNLISNIGFGDEATNAIEDPFGIADRPLEGMDFPLVHPPSIGRDRETDARVSRSFYRHPEPPAGPSRLYLTFDRARDRALRAGGRALDFVPERIRPRIRHRDRRPE
jgi:hypothetical protein